LFVEKSFTQQGRLNPGELTEVPFRSWFRAHFSLPSLSLGLILFLARLNDWAPEQTLTVVLLGILFAPIILCALPLALINFVIHLGVEPLVTFVRDKLGYSRMVHVRDFPEVAVLPEQPAAV
jgi:hypothetical protein